MSNPTPVSDAALASDETLVTPAPTPRASRWEDFIDILYAPSAVFERRRDSGFGIPMLVVWIVGAVIFYAFFSAMSTIMDAEFTRNMARMADKGLTPEKIAGVRSVGEKIAKVSALVGPPVLMFITGFVLWLCGKLVGAKQTFTAAVMVTAYAQVPRIIGGLATGVQALFMDPSHVTGIASVSVGLARFLDLATASPLMIGLASRLDLFTIWTTVLLAIGLSVTGRIPKGTAAIAAGLVWVLGSLPVLMQALQ